MWDIRKIKILKDFKIFLLKHGVIGLATGVVIGGAVGKLVQALVQDLIMPVIGFITPTGNWRQLTFDVGPVKFALGDFIGHSLDFSIVAFVIFILMKILTMRGATLLPGMKQCPECLEHIPAAARKCKFCLTTFGQ